MTQFSVNIVHKPDVPLYIGKWTDLVQSYSPGENFDSPQDNTTLYSGSAAGDLVLRSSQSGGVRDSDWITVLVKTSTVSRTIPVSSGSLT